MIKHKRKVKLPFKNGKYWNCYITDIRITSQRATKNKGRKGEKIIKNLRKIYEKKGFSIFFESDFLFFFSFIFCKTFHSNWFSFYIQSSVLSQYCIFIKYLK